MKYLYKDQIRKIRKNLLNFICLGLLVMIISITYTSSKQSIIRLEKNYDQFVSTQYVEDFRFNLASVDVNYLKGTEFVYLCRELDVEFECYYNISLGTKAAYDSLNLLINNKIDEQPEKFQDYVDDYIEDIEEEYELIIEKKNYSDVQDGIHKYKFTNITSQIDIPLVIEGELPDELYEIMVYPEFAYNNDLSVGDELVIKDVTYTITGLAYTPDYTFPIYYMNTMDVEKDTLVITTNETIELLDNYIQRKYVGLGSISDIVDAKTFKEIQETDTSALGKSTQVKNVRPASSNWAISTIVFEIQNANIFIDSFIYLFIGFVTLLVLIFLRRYLNKNKNDIEILKKLGYSNHEISKALMILPFIISLMTLLGYLIGLLISNPLYEQYSARYLFPREDFHLDHTVYLFAVVIPFMFINIISYLFIRYSIKEKQYKKRFIKLRIFKFTPFRTIASTFVIMLTVSVMMLFGTNGNTMFDTFLEETKQGNNFEEMLLLDYFTDEAIDESYEPFTRQSGKITTINNIELEKTYGLRVYGINPTNDIKLLINNDVTNNSLVEEGVIISEYVRYNLGIDIGDTIIVTIKDEPLEYEVMGVSNELVENNIFINIVDINDVFNLDETYYNGIYTTDNEFHSDDIIQRINYDQGLRDISRLLDASSIIINYILILSALISVFTFVLLITNYLSDNKLEISILKAIGHNSKEIGIKYLMNIYIVFVVSFIASIPLTRLMFDLLLKTLIDRLGYILVVRIETIHIVISFLLLNLIFTMTAYFTSQYYERINVVDIIKENTK